jgi:hypothetical protein
MKSSGKLPLFIKDPQGKWYPFPIQAFTHSNAGWYVTYNSWLKLSKEEQAILRICGCLVSHASKLDIWFLKE